MSRCCVCYIANKGYLFSTLLSATQAVRHVSPDLADVAIFSLGEAHAESEAVARACALEGIRFFSVDPALIDGLHIYFARLLVDRFLPSEYDQVLYMDGDTQVVDSLDPLVALAVPAGRVAAVRDPLTLMAVRDGRTAQATRRRWASLGLADRDFPDYVNSGILRFNRNGWAEIGARCVTAYQAAPARYAYPDQDVLNTEARDRLDVTSFAWNFPGFFLVHDLQKIVAPRIVHFMSNPRPWHGPLPAFRRAWHQPYLDLIERHPDLAAFRPQLGRRAYARYVLQQHYVRLRNESFWGSNRTGADLARVEALVAA